MDTDKRTIKKDKGSNQIMNIKDLSYLLSVLSVCIGGNLYFLNLLRITLPEPDIPTPRKFRWMKAKPERIWYIDINLTVSAL